MRIATDQGAVDRELPDTPGPHRLSTLPGLTTTVRVTVLALREDYVGGAVALRELGDPRRDRAARAARAHDVTAAARRRSTRSTAGRATAARASAPAAIRCDQFLARAGEEPHGIDRFFSTPVNAAYDLRLTARPRPGAAACRWRRRR